MSVHRGGHAWQGAARPQMGNSVLNGGLQIMNYKEGIPDQ